MTDDSTIQAPSRPVQCLDGPEALLTAEWKVADLPRLNPDETMHAARPSVMPPAPSRRRADVAAAARTGEARSHQPAMQPSRQHGVTVPRAERAVHAVPAIVINDPGVTLPPRDQRDAEGAPQAISPSVATRIRRGRGRPPFVALVAAVGCTFGYAVWTALLRPAAANTPSAQPLPHFLQEHAATVDGPAVAPTPSPSTLPPELAATLAQALPPATREASSFAGDAGAPAAPSTMPENTPTAENVSSETHRRAAALRAVLEAQRARPKPSSSDSTSKASAPPAPTRVARATPELVTKWPSNPPPRRQAPRSAPTPPTVPLPTSRANSAVRPLTTYTYQDQALFAVATAPMRVTDLVLERGEKLVAQPTAGDAARWVISVVPGESQTHVFVKPLRRGLKTNLTLTTNRRSYFLELSTRDDGSYMAGVAWQYPLDETTRRREALVQAERERQSTTAVSDLQALRFDYRIDVSTGSAPWKPTMVFDDGQKTFIRFAKPVAPSMAPLLFVLQAGSTKDAKFVNYRIKNDLYVLDRIIDAAELRLAPSDGDQSVVRITRQHP